MSKMMCKSKKEKENKNPKYRCKKCDALVKEKKKVCKPEKI